ARGRRRQGPRRDARGALLDPHARRRRRPVGQRRERTAPIARDADQPEELPSVLIVVAPVDPIPPTIEWRDGAIRLLDQPALPGTLAFVRCADVDALIDAIATLAVRGAPALGAAGVYGVALAAATLRTKREVRGAAARIADARPTAVNLAWGVERGLAAF